MHEETFLKVIPAEKVQLQGATVSSASASSAKQETKKKAGNQAQVNGPGGDWRRCCQYFEDDASKTLEMRLGELPPKLAKAHPSPEWYANRTIREAFDRVRGKAAVSLGQNARPSNVPLNTNSNVGAIGNASEHEAGVGQLAGTDVLKDEVPAQKMATIGDAQAKIDAAIEARLPSKKATLQMTCCKCMRHFAKDSFYGSQ